jgi:hypothetical protein
MRAAAVAAGASLCAGWLSGCADREPEPAPAATTTGSAAVASSPTATTSTSPTSTGLPGMPLPVSVGTSPVDSNRLRSVDDLPSVFQCPSSVAPIRIPATPVDTAATVPPAPDAVVCASALADNEAVYLWYAPTPESKLGALTEALAKTKYVHAGPNWVAGGLVNPTMGTIGGEVYR